MYPLSKNEYKASHSPSLLLFPAKRRDIRLAGTSLVQAAALAMAACATAQTQDTLLHSIPGLATGLQTNAQLGTGVTVDGNYTVVGAPYDDIGATNSGVVKVFHTQTGELLHIIPNPTPAENDLFGISCSISGTRLVVGAPEDDTGAINSGSAYVFDLNSATPTEPVTILSRSTRTAQDYFGRSVSISGTRVVVGAHQVEITAGNTVTSNAGSAYVFALDSQTPQTPVATIDNPTPAADDWFGWSVGISGTRVVIGAHQDDTVGSNAGSAYVYSLGIDNTPTLVATLNKPIPRATNDQFGISVAVSGMRAVVGATGDDTGASNAGSAYVYDLDNPMIAPLILNNPGPAADDGFGISVAISSSRLVVGAHLDDNGASNAGSAYIYNFGSSTPAAVLNNPSPAVADWFGRSVAISDTHAVIGTPYDDTGAIDSGSAYVYQSTNTAPNAKLNNPGPAAGNRFGQSVAVSGTRMVVGMPFDDTDASDAGSAYVYDLSGATPTVPVLTLKNPDPVMNDQFGNSVAISGTRVVVGAYLDDSGASNAGSAYVYDLGSSTPAEPLFKLQNPSPASDDWFGISVAISGTRAVVGAYLDDTGAINAGSAYVYDLPSGTPQTPPLPTVINNPNPAAQDFFGFAVAISGSRVVIGAYLDDVGASPDAGSAYVYDLDTPLAPPITLNNPSQESGDSFGYAVGISGTRVVIGSYLNDTGAPNSGCAYVYDLASGSPTPSPVTLPNPAPADSDSFGTAVAISSSRVLIGVPNQDYGASNAGRAYVFDLESQTPLSPVTTLNNPNPAVDDLFGSSVAIDGKTCVIGVPADNSIMPDSGAAFVFGPAAQISVEQPSGTVLPENGAAIDAGDVFVGSSGGSLTFTIRNNGTANLNGIAVSLGGSNAGDFVLDDATTAASLPPGASTTFSVQFSPDTAGELTANISIASSNGDVNPFVISLSGTGVLPSVSVAVAPESVTEDGTEDLVFIFTRNSATGGELTVAFGVSGSAVFGSDFSQSGGAAFSETAGTVTFAAESSTATVTISPTADNALEPDETVTLTMTAGSGYQIASPDSASGTITNDDVADQIILEQPADNELTSGSSTVDYGALFIGTQSSKSFVIRNAGTQPITGLVIETVGSENGDFSVGSISSSLAAGESSSFSVTFTPSAGGARATTLRITSDGIGDSPYVVNLAGSGLTARDLFDDFMEQAGQSGADAEPGATPFDDGVSNLLKYAFNMDASGPDTRVLVPATGEAGLPVLLINGGATPLVHYEFLRRKNSGLTYVALQSVTLAADSWEPMTGTTTVTNINDAWERVVIEQPGTEPKRFFQVQVVMD